jgi:RNA polymerase sigma-70 factor (family 1)
MANPLPIVPDSEIVARIRGGDEAAFEQLFLEQYPRLCMLAARMLGSDALAEELVQDVLLHIWDHRETWDITSSVAGYLATAVRNRALNLLQRERTEQRWAEGVRDRGWEHPVIALHGEQETPDEHVTSGELGDAIAQAIEKLPPRCRQAFILRRQRQLSYTEIAQIMEISPKTVEIQIGLALKTLRKQLSAWLDP